jgi:hypothetical protein
MFRLVGAGEVVQRPRPGQAAARKGNELVRTRIAAPLAAAVRQTQHGAGREVQSGPARSG